MKRTSQILTIPDWRRGNPYLDLLGDAVRSAHPEVDMVYATPDPQPLSLLRTARRYPQARTLHLHWLDHFVESIGWSKRPWLRALKLRLFQLELALLRLAGRRLIWTIHNLYTHDGTNRALERKVYRSVAHRASAILVHSEEALALAQKEYGVTFGTKGHVIPHGNYHGRYCAPVRDPVSIDPRLTPSDARVNVLFFGALRPYKGITELMASLAAAPDARITVAIAGKGEDVHLAQAVQAYAQRDSRVVPIIRFISEDDVPTLFEWADALVVPFERTLTSGSVILSMTMGRPVVLPETARVIGIANNANCVFFSPGALAAVLGQLDKADLGQKRDACKQAAAALDWSRIGVRLAQIYELQEHCSTEKES